MDAHTFTLERDGFGRLVFRSASGETHVGVVPVRAFPLTAPSEGVSLVRAGGHEVAWIDSLDELAPPLRAAIEAEFEGREFIPRISRVVGVSTFSTPSTWQVDTDRGPAGFVLKAEEDIRRLGPNSLLIASSHGLQFLIPDTASLDRASRRLLERFL